MDNIAYETHLAKKIGEFKYRPLDYVMYAFPWGEKGGPLEKFDGPDVWQREYLLEMQKAFATDQDAAIQFATSSGHGIGKSALTSFIILWHISTHPHAAGNVTANTWAQLSTKTWREVELWRQRAINGHWFETTTSRIFHKDFKETWGINALSNSEKNSEAFAGLHSSQTLIIFDEASAIPDIIWEVSEGAMTDPHAQWHVFGNPTRNQGRFKECWGKFGERWNTRQVDSRQAMMTDKNKIAQWSEDYGEDSDFMRVRVRGVFPRAASDQLISEEVINAAVSRASEPRDYLNYPLFLGVDVSRGGADDSVIMTRQGPKAEIYGTYQITDLMLLAGKVVEAYNELKPSTVFVDATGLGAGVYDRLKELGLPVVAVSFGSSPVDNRMYANCRAEIWSLMRDWLAGEVDIPYSPKLSQDLLQQTYGYTEKLQIQLESKRVMKSRGLESPDMGDALAVTFYQESMVHLVRNTGARQVVQSNATGWS